MDFNNPSTPYRVKSLLDTDLYKVSHTVEDVQSSHDARSVYHATSGFETFPG